MFNWALHDIESSVSEVSTHESIALTHVIELSIVLYLGHHDWENGGEFGYVPSFYISRSCGSWFVGIIFRFN